MGLFGRLVVVPYEQIETLAAQKKLETYSIDPGYVKATVGDNILEASSAQVSFDRIECSGDTVIATVLPGAYRGNRSCGMGPLLSRDGGKTFQWAQYNLPVGRYASAAVTDTEILLGGIGGAAYRWDLTKPLKPSRK